MSPFELSTNPITDTSDRNTKFSGSISLGCIRNAIENNGMRVCGKFSLHSLRCFEFMFWGMMLTIERIIPTYFTT